MTNEILFCAETLREEEIEIFARPRVQLASGHMNVAQKLIRLQFPDIGGLMGVSFSPMAAYSRQEKQRWMQIIHSPRHWVLIVAKGFSPDQPDTLFVYDSMQFQERNRQQVLAVMSSLVRVKESFMSYVVATCQRQASGSNDCGLFAIAFATSLAFSEDPSTRLYDSVACRKHLKKCFEENNLTVLPSRKKIKRVNDQKTRPKIIAVYCHCRRTDNEYARMRASDPDSSWEMIQCGKCSEHFHRMCEDYTENPKLDWFCRSCRQCKSD